MHQLSIRHCSGCWGFSSCKVGKVLAVMMLISECVGTFQVKKKWVQRPWGKSMVIMSEEKQRHEWMKRNWQQRKTLGGGVGRWWQWIRITWVTIRMLGYIGSHWRILRRSGTLDSYFVKGSLQGDHNYKKPKVKTGNPIVMVRCSFDWGGNGEMGDVTISGYILKTEW